MGYADGIKKQQVYNVYYWNMFLTPTWAVYHKLVKVVVYNKIKQNIFSGKSVQLLKLSTPSISEQQCQIWHIKNLGNNNI